MDFDTVPAHLLAPQSNGKVFWEPECWSQDGRTAAEHWARSGRVEGIQVDCCRTAGGTGGFRAAVEDAARDLPSDAEALTVTRALYRFCARYRNVLRAGTNPYDPGLRRGRCGSLRRTRSPYLREIDGACTGDILEPDRAIGASRRRA